MTRADQPLVAVVVLNHNRSAELKECLRSISQADFANRIVFVVDNGSTDGSETLARHAFPEVEIVQAGMNRGYSGGMNVGIEHALARNPVYLFLLNSDTVLDHRCISLLVTSLESNVDWAAASGTIVCYPNTQDAWYAGGTLSLIRASGFSRRGRWNGQTTGKQKTVTFASGCALMLRSSAIRTVGAFDERFFLYLEDTELCRRLQDHAYGIVYVPEALIYHKVGSDQRKAYQIYFNTRNRFLFVSGSKRVLTRWMGYVYLLVTYSLKIPWWLVSQPHWSRAAMWGWEDFRAGQFYEGRGMTMMKESEEAQTDRP